MHEKKAYWTHELARLLAISDSTLRKWCIDLEKHGYVFVKGEQNSRAFVEHDRKALQHFKDLVQGKRLTKEEASKIVVNQWQGNRENGGTTPMQAENIPVHIPFDHELMKIHERLDEQAELTQEILERMDQRDQKLITVLREIHETKIEIAVAKKKRWWQFWK